MAEPWSDNDVLTAANLAGMPWGVVGYVNGSSSAQAGISSVTDLTGLSVTWTAVSTRLYVVLLTVGFTQASSTGNITVRIADGSSTSQAFYQNTLAASSHGQITVTELLTGASGSTTRKGRIETSAGTVSVGGSTNNRPRLIVLDVGAA